jgi:excinuclease ABC subunit A
MPATAPVRSASLASEGSASRSRARTHIVLRGVRQHNLKGLDIDLPKQKLIVVTGPSGSGKSSLAFDTIYAEGQRRYVESLSAYARQFLERMDKPDADLISGLAPAIAIEQKTVSKNPRSTVATQTEVYDHLRLLFARIGTTYSPVSGEIVTKDSPRSVALELEDKLEALTRFYLAFPLPQHKKTKVAEELAALRERGFFRLLVLPTPRQAEKGKTEEVLDLNDTDPASVRIARVRLLVLVDRLALKPGEESVRSRIADSVEMAFREGGGRCVVIPRGEPSVQLAFSEHFERDGMTFVEPSPLLFSFNSPVGACPTCQGFGRVPGVDEDLVIPNPLLTLRQGAVAPFRTEQWSKYFRDLVRAAARLKMPIDVPYEDLSDEHKRVVWEGSGDYVGVNGFFEFLQKRSYKMHYRIYNARFRGYTRCPDCHGYRVREDALYVKIGGPERVRMGKAPERESDPRPVVGPIHIGEIGEMTTADALDFFDRFEPTQHQREIAGRVLEEIHKRLRYLVDVGLDYLTLDRLSQTLSGGESQRINLATSLGSSLVGSLYVLDEPSIGLHPRDTGRLISILKNLRDIGNTVLVVEHEADMMRAADQIVDIGPGSGSRGGEVVFQGTYDEVLTDEASLTGAYLSGRKEIAVPEVRREVDPEHVLVVKKPREHNLKRMDVTVPLGLVCCVTGVSGSGKSTLVEDIVFRGVQRALGQFEEGAKIGAHDYIEGTEHLEAAEMVDQSPIGKTPRSNPVTYIKAFDAIRKLLADTRQAQVRGYKAGTFSFNVPGGRCETCQGEGVVQIEMQFLADLYLECEACRGRRFKQEVLEVRWNGKNVDDMLNMTVDEGVDFFTGEKALASKMQVLQDIGLGYLTLGQPSNTLSGGEAQRIKLAAILGKLAKERTLYVFDEPTTGLHFDDVRKLIDAFDQLVEAGHSVLIVEHNLDVLKCADYVIDLGPEGGRAGGEVVAAGTPEEVAATPGSHTGRYLKPLLR